MKLLKGILLAACALTIGFATFLQFNPVSAQSSAALSIAPKKNYTIEPGKTVNDRLSIRNLDHNEDLHLTLQVVDFTYTDDTGSPKLLLDQDTPWSLKPFLNIPETVTISPNSSESVDLSVSIPPNHGAGTYYSAIMYSTGAAEGGNVGLSASGVTLVFTSIPGDVDEKLTLEKFGAYLPVTPTREAGYTFITNDEPSMVAYTLKNEGNVAQSPSGSITVKHMFGQEYVIEDVNPNESLALIGQTRTFTSCLKLKSAEVDFNGSRTEASECASPGLWPGYYSASIDLFYGWNGNETKEVHGSGGFWYMPWWFVIALVIVLAVVAYFVWRIVHFFRASDKVFGTGSKKIRRRR